MYAEIEKSGLTVLLSIDNEDVDVIDAKAVAANQGITLTDDDFTPYRGVIRVRFAFYLEPDDARYAERYVHIPVVPKGGYPGKTDEGGRPVDQSAYDTWLAGLPHVWQNTPFHNHFDQVSADITDTELQALMRKRLVNFGNVWVKGSPSNVLGEEVLQMERGWDRDDKHNKTKANYDRCANKALDIAAREKDFKGVR